jgi:hypothetical protein
MSCVAEKNATATAAAAVNHGAVAGSLQASSTVEARMPTWAASIQLRRRPSSRSSSGSGRRSTSGAQANLNA